MPSFITPSLAASPTITDTVTDVNAASVLNITNPLYTAVQSFDGFTWSSVITSNTVLTANTQVAVPVNASGGNVIIDLPPLAGQVTPIFIKKVDATFPASTIASPTTGVVTIRANGSDRIENPTTAELAPTATTVSLRMPNEEMELIPLGGGWRIVHRYFPNRVLVRAFQNAAVTVSATPSPNNFTQILFQDDSTTGSRGYDLSNNFASSVFTAPVPCFVDVAGQIAMNSGVTSYTDFWLYINGTLIQGLGGSNVVNAEFHKVPIKADAVLCAAGDTIDIRGRSETTSTSNTSAARATAAGTTNTYVTFTLRSLNY